MLSLVWLLFAAFATAQGNLTVDLDYGSFKGAFLAEYNISYWQKIPFAAKPLGPNRFRRPQPPEPITNGTYDSSQTFDMCTQRATNGSEDCLYLGLYGRPWSKGDPLRPVVVVWHGGAFIQGSASFTIPPSMYPTLNASATNDFIVIYSGYRLNAFGFLPGKEIAKDACSDLNVGLLDQQAALQWTHRYIKYFGGDPGNVTIQGQSAGGGSVVAQIIANGGSTKPKLFSKALISSPFWPKTYRYDSSEAQEIYDKFAELAGCTGNDSLACLKAANVQTLRNASLAISASHTYNTSSYTWAPVIDSEFIREPLSQATARGAVNTDFGFGTFNSHEGENFIPPGFQNASGANGFNSSVTSFNSWLSGFLPELSGEELDHVRSIYPEPGVFDELTYNTTHERSYLSEYTIEPAKHGSDTQLWNSINLVQQQNRLIYEGYTGAFASFFQTGDPNAHKVTNQSVPGVAELTRSGNRFVISANGFQNKSVIGLERRCEFWRSVAERIPI